MNTESLITNKTQSIVRIDNWHSILDNWLCQKHELLVSAVKPFSSFTFFIDGLLLRKYEFITRMQNQLTSNIASVIWIRKVKSGWKFFSFQHFAAETDFTPNFKNIKQWSNRFFYFLLEASTIYTVTHSLYFHFSSCHLFCVFFYLAHST